MTDIVLTRQTGHSERLVIGMVGAAHFLSHFFQLALPPLFPLLRESFGVDYVALGLVMTLFYGTSGVCQAFAGILVDRFGAKRMLLIGLGVLAGSIGLAGLVPSYVALLPLAMLAGAGNSVFHPADLSILSLKVGEARLGRAYSIHAFSGTLGYVTAPVVIGGIALATDWRTALVTAGLLGLVTVAALWLSGPHLSTDGAALHRDARPGHPPARRISYGRLITTPSIMLAFGYFALSAAAGVGVQTFAVSALVKIHGLALPVATTALTAYLLGMATGMLAGGILADRTRRHDLVAMGGMAAAAAFMLAIATGQLPFAGVLVAIALGGFFAGATAPSRDLLVRAATPPGSTGKVFGFVYSGLDLGASLSPLLLGALLDHGMPRAVFVGVAIFLLLTILTVFSVRRPAHSIA